MANKIYLTQRTDRHVVKRLSADSMPATYDLSFGVYKVPALTASNLNFPWGLTRDASGNIYVCDVRNNRIVKLNSNLSYLGSYSTLSTVGTPYIIYFDSITGDLYIVGTELIYGTAIKIERITTSLVNVKTSGNMRAIKDLSFKPTTICRGFTADTFLIGGASLDLLETIESTNFSAFVVRSIYGETTTYPELFATTKYNGIIKHTNGNFYLNNGQRILKVNSSFVNIGDSDFISKTIFGLRQGLSNTLLVYNADSQKIQRYDENLNFVEDVYVDSGDVIATDAYDIMDFIEVSI